MVGRQSGAVLRLIELNKDCTGPYNLGEDRECDGIASAIACGRELLAFGDYQKIEVWIKNARLGFVQKNGPNDRD